MRRTTLIVLAVSLAVPMSLSGLASASAKTGLPTTHKNVCPRASAGFMQCFSKVLVGSNDRPYGSPTVMGYGPADLQDAYNLPSGTNGAGQTIAVVDAYDDPNAQSDLAVYRSTFGLPPCTKANGCFRKIDQNGGTHYPMGHTGWAQEISLDLDMASAICPLCHLLLVEATSNSRANLFAAVSRAVTEGATEVSNSWGGSEYSGENVDDANVFQHAGVAITAASGDSGYGVTFPAASQYVTAVGGTRLAHFGGVWTETAWPGAGSGCSAFVPKPSWQNDERCDRRTVADVAAVADPLTGVAVYDTYGTDGWLIFGGTSVAAPIIAGVYALGGGNVLYGSQPYSSPEELRDVVGGWNGSCGRKAKKYLCTGVVGYDGPTGLGVPNGVEAF